MKVYTTDDVAETLSVSRRTIERHIESGNLEAMKIGRLIRITQDQLNAFLLNSVYDPFSKGEAIVTGSIPL